MPHYIIDELKKVEPREREALAERLLQIFHGSAQIPTGYYNPKIFDPENIPRVFAEDYAFYTDLEKLVEQPPEIFSHMKKKFLRTARQSQKILRLSPEQRFEIPLHRWPKYMHNFERTIREQFYDHNEYISPLARDMHFLQKRIGGGGIAEVYLGRYQKKEYAVRIAHPQERFNDYVARTKRTLIEQIKINLTAKKELFQARPFVILEEVGPTDHGEAICIMELFKGKNVRTEINGGIKKDEELRTRITKTYAEMLSLLHARGLVFLDNSWSNIVFSENDTAVCDYDFVSTPDEARIWFEDIGTYETASREQILDEKLSSSSDLESFALMLDQMYNHDSLIRNSIEVKENITLAKRNTRKYPKRRKENIPPKLKELVTALITYPKDYSITIKDFLQVL